MSNHQHQHHDLSDFDRVNRIGTGSGSTVYKVLHRPTAAHFALKVIYGLPDQNVHRQILHQIEILQGIDNLNIVKLHDMFDRGEIQVLLEYMDGGSLKDKHLSDESSLADYTRQILSGLDYLHRHKIAHLHIKPSNLLINSRKEVKIAVSGVTRMLELIDSEYTMGTIAYMCPERINTDMYQGKNDGFAGDIWSMGLSILECYMGVLPLEGGRDDWASLMMAICMSPPPKAPATASREFQDFVTCCLQTNPAKRWTTAQLLGHPFVTGEAIEGVSTLYTLNLIGR